MGQVQGSLASASAGPCSGLLVVDMSSIVSGPLGSRILADLGATVIKVETTASDTAMRANPPVYNAHSAFYEQVNYGKMGLNVDVKSPEGIKVIKALCKRADVFFQNSRPGVMERLGLGYEEIKSINPGIIYVSVTGFGETGKFKDNPAYDNAVQGIVGFMPTQGTSEHPQAVYSPVADKISAIWAANATLAALLFRERNGGVGQKVVVNMVSAYASFILTEEMNNETFRSADLPRVPPPKQPYQTLTTADGTVVGLILMPAQYKAFCKSIGRPELQDDPIYATTAGLISNIEAFYKAIAEDVKKLTTSDFLTRMKDANVPFGKVNSTREFMESEVAAETGSFVDIDDPEFGIIRHLAHPVQYSVSPANCMRRAPKIGEHNEEILTMIAQDLIEQ